VRVLVDQCLPRHGVLLRAAIDAGFEVFITNDSSIEFQQNVARIGIAVVAVVGFRNRMPDLRPLILRILAALTTVKPGEVVTIGRETV